MNTEKQASDLDKVLAELGERAGEDLTLPSEVEALLRLLVKVAFCLPEVRAVANLAHANSVRALESAAAGGAV